MKTTIKSLAIFGIVSISCIGTIKADNCADDKGTNKQISAKQVDAKHMNIVETASAAGSFKTLIAAVKAAGLEETLKGKGPFTVFAPTDEAFAKLPAGTVEALLKDKAKLTAILTYHVVAGKVMAADAIKLTEAKTVNGQSFKIAAGKDGVMIDNAKVVATDIIASNGVIHVIDNVILPKEEAKK